MRRRLWITALLGLVGCGIPINTGKPPTTSLPASGAAVVTATSTGAFSAQLDSSAPVLATGEQDQPPSGSGSTRGVTGTCRLGETFDVQLSGGTGVQLVVVGPERSDLVVVFTIGGGVQRIDSDPLSPDLTVETMLITAQRDLTLQIKPRDIADATLTGVVRWYAFQLASSQGRVRTDSALAGPADTTSLPGSFEFDAPVRGERLELLVVGPSGSDLVVQLNLGGRRVELDNDPQSPRRNVEGCIIRVDDPVHVTARVTNFDGDSLAGDVRWAVIRLPDNRARD